MRKKPNMPPKEYTLETLFSYALWYTGKYRISRAKLTKKLSEKTSNQEFVDQLLVEIAPYHSDTTEIQSLVEESVSLSKPTYALRSKLRQKGFLKEDIEAVLDAEKEEFENFSNYSTKIEKRISDLCGRGYGPRHINVDLLSKYPQFKMEIEGLVNKIPSREVLKSYSNELSKLGADRKKLKKFQDTLARKGFSYSEISKFVGDKQED